MTLETPPTKANLTTLEAAGKISNIINPADQTARKVEKTETEGGGQEGKDDPKGKKPVSTAKSQGKKEAVKAKPDNPNGAKAAKQATDENDPFLAEDTAETSQKSETDDPLLSDAENQDDDASSDEDADNEAAKDAEGKEDGENEGEDEEQLHTVIVDGEEVQVPYSELLDGYMRLSDYSKKMAQVQTERKGLEAEREKVKDLPEVKKKLNAETERFTKNAQLVLLALQNRFMPGEPDAELAKTDPASYIKMKEQRQEAIQFMQGIGLEFQKVEERATQERLKEVQEGRTKLMQTLPELKDAANRQKLRNYAKAHGFTDQQIAAEPNPVLFQWAWKAAKYDELMQRRDVLRKSARPTPKVLKNTKAPEGHKAIAERKKTEILAAHKRSGGLNTATAAISGIIRKQS